jgi:glycosyltransferase involved in cell wall biosynthesis
LARELARLGHDVAFYSVVPPHRTRRFGLPQECNRWLLPYLFPWTAADLFFRHYRNSGVKVWFNRRSIEALDNTAARYIRPCDVVIAVSGLFNRTLAAARRRFGAKIWVERGSRHILSQKAILDALPNADRVPAYAVSRELCDYDRADVVSLLSRHCEESFLDVGFPAGKLVRNPLGVDLNMFPPTPAPPPNPPTVVMAGNWSYQKGCDVLTEAWRKLPGVNLVHVGPVSDCPLPTDPHFQHYDKVDQPRLVDFYRRSHVFALASRQEGMAIVIPQALASGLRVVCTDRTGGEDLRGYVDDPDVIQVVPSDRADALAGALSDALRTAGTETGPRDRLGAGRDALSWAAYGKRYEAELLRRL